MAIEGRLRAGVFVGLVLAGCVVGSLALVTVTSARTPMSPSPAPSPLNSNSSAPTSPEKTVPPTPTPTPTPTPSPSPTPSVASTPRPAPAVREFYVGPGTEPTVAADPFHAGVVAVVSQHIISSAAGKNCSRPEVQFSRDDGASWSAGSRPWRMRCDDVHAVIAWGPGGRLWVANAVIGSRGVSLAIKYTEDLGKTWSGEFVQDFTPPWVGCFPSLTVDNWPESPNFGTVYAAYNWLPDNKGPGVAVIASRDGRTWTHAEVAANSMTAYPFSWRIGYRIKAAPDGTAYVSYYQSSLKSWNSAKPLEEGIPWNIGGAGFEMARVRFDGTSLSVDQPLRATNMRSTKGQWQSGLAVDSSGRAWLAVDRSGVIGLGGVDRPWRTFSIPDSSSFKPSLAISGQTIFLGWHATDECGLVRTYFSLSYDGGATFSAPALVSKASWLLRSVDVYNGVGLRENAEFENGVVYYTYGDGRSGLGIYMAQVRP
jgi:hypothetical protein